MPPRTSTAGGTPRRATRGASRTPAPALPALSTRQSHAYGAPGKTTLQSQIVGANTDLASIMNARREQTVDRSLPPPSVDRMTYDSASYDDDSLSVAQDMRDATFLTSKAPYAPSITSRISSPAPPPPRQAVIEPEWERPRSPSLSQAKSPLKSPHPFRVFWRTFVRYVPRILKESETELCFRWNTIWNSLRSLLTLLLILTTGAIMVTGAFYFLLIPLGLAMKFAGDVITLGVATLAPLPDRLHGWRETTISQIVRNHKIPPFDVPPADLEASWNAFKHERLFSGSLPEYNVPEMQWSINVNFLERLEKVERLVDGVTAQAKLHNDTMTLIRDMLPHLMVVQTKNGDWKIPEQFWHALIERLGSENREASQLWQNFMKSNEAQLMKLNENSASTVVQRSLQKNLIVSREMVEEALRRNYASLQQVHTQGLAEVEKRILQDARQLAESTSKDLIERTPAHKYAKMQAQSLAYTNVLVNTRDAMHELNYFSPGLGASIHYRLTSPTQLRNGALLPRLYSLFAGNPENPPLTALRDWKEATDCWCSARSDLGQAQISVDLQHRIAPTRLIIEHMPAKGTLNIGAAPRNLEVWARVRSRDEARRLTKIVGDNSGSSKEEQCGESPGDRYVCLGKGSYDIHSDNWVQSFLLSANAEEIGLSTDNIVIRVVKNWGAQYTCLYRLRLTGSRAEK